jgi:hypothetical protein
MFPDEMYSVQKDNSKPPSIKRNRRETRRAGFIPNLSTALRAVTTLALGSWGRSFARIYYEARKMCKPKLFKNIQMSVMSNVHAINTK